MFINVHNDVSGAQEEVRGSDNRMNVSSRSDSRSYYNSRDVGQAYSLVFDFQSAAATEYGVYLQNTSSTKTIVVDAIGINAAQNARMKLHFVTGTATAGNAVTPVNLNGGSPNAADCVAREGGSEATGIAGLTIDKTIDFAAVQADGHEEFRLDDRLRLGQNQAIAIEYDEGTGGDMFGVIFFFFE